uniref:Uncharacterized protein n=1 Tax=Nelumbo nucifera TaxID=4432 RepID=A0A822ZTV3_NELNU|nr:TPA_asm: hypothetical protein HUJ06_017917 [Nelumbo nucifera]
MMIHFGLSPPEKIWQIWTSLSSSLGCRARRKRLPKKDAPRARASKVTQSTDEEGIPMVVIKNKPQVKSRREPVEGQTLEDHCTAPSSREPTILGTGTLGRHSVFDLAMVLELSKVVVIPKDVIEHHKKCPIVTGSITLHHLNVASTRDLPQAMQLFPPEYITLLACQEAKDDYALSAFRKGFKVCHMLAKSLFPETKFSSWNSYNVLNAMLVGKESDSEPKGSNGDEEGHGSSDNELVEGEEASKVSDDQPPTKE